MEKKMTAAIDIECKKFPIEIGVFITYCQSLKFDERPDYNFLRKILRDVL
jgi:hypothetical protein